MAISRGTGGSAVLSAAAGYRVVGRALAGKAADGLEKETGIISRTLASWELGWKNGRDALNNKTIFVLDEAGMVASRQMALFVETASKAGAKLVLVGDPEQLQPIEAGAAFRAIVERIGYAELETVYRQRDQWMRDASLDLARGRTAQALASLVAEIGDGQGSVENRRRVEVEQRFYRNVDHGYATTVHKAQGATVDRVKVLATLSARQAPTYVALTRHREDVALYYGRRSFQFAGGLIPILSQRRAKEITLDYKRGALYRAALRRQPRTGW